MGLAQVSLARFQEAVEIAQAITIDDLRNVLPKPNDLKKGALIPHPTGSADLRVVDEQMTEDAAGYWLRFLGARTGPKQPELAKLTAALIAGAVEEATAPRTVVAEQFAEVARSSEPVPLKQMVQRAAQAAGLDVDLVFDRVKRAEPSLDLDQTLSPTTAEKTKTTIDLGHGITVSGPITELDKRFSDSPSPGGGWDSTIHSDQRAKWKEPRRRA